MSGITGFEGENMFLFELRQTPAEKIIAAGQEAAAQVIITNAAFIAIKFPFGTDTDAFFDYATRRFLEDVKKGDKPIQSYSSVYFEPMALGRYRDSIVPATVLVKKYYDAWRGEIERQGQQDKLVDELPELAVPGVKSFSSLEAARKYFDVHYSPKELKKGYLGKSIIGNETHEMTLTEATQLSATIWRQISSTMDATLTKNGTIAPSVLDGRVGKELAYRAEPKAEEPALVGIVEPKLPKVTKGEK